jgi:sorbitol-specific phosphotransferase system component IIA
MDTLVLFRDGIPEGMRSVIVVSRQLTNRRGNLCFVARLALSTQCFSATC